LLVQGLLELIRGYNSALDQQFPYLDLFLQHGLSFRRDS